MLYSGLVSIIHSKKNKIIFTYWVLVTTTEKSIETVNAVFGVENDSSTNCMEAGKEAAVDGNAM